MKPVTMRLLLTGLALAFAGIVLAEDTVYFREPGKKKDETIFGTIENESPVGIKFKSKAGKVSDIPAGQIVQVEYGNNVVSRLDFRKPDSQLAKALDETQIQRKKDGLRSALIGFQGLDGGELSRNPPIHRYLQYRIAQTMTYQAREDVSRRDDAIRALQEFKTSFADGWEIVPALQMLAALQEDKGDTEGASRTYTDLAEVSGISAAMKLQSQLRGARLLLRVKKFADAESKLKQVEAAMPADDPQRDFVAVYLLQSRIAQGSNLDGIDKKLTQTIQGSKDDGLRGLAHNTLGDYYRVKNELNLAFWEYCKVDMLYTQDREEHAKALYHLSKLFDLPRNNLTRAEECQTRLNSSSFNGTLYQRLAAAEQKAKK
jgi:hypothetical protein